MASAPGIGRELWKSDGTAEGTVLVKEITPGIDGTFISSPVNVNGTLFFAAGARTLLDELWKSDGTAAGTVAVRPIPTFVTRLTNVDGTIYFAAASNEGSELWKSDGTSEGTVFVQDINPGFDSSNPGPFMHISETLYFAADDGTHGRELWFLPLEPADSRGDPGVPMPSLAPSTDDPDTPDAWLSAPAEEPIAVVEPDPNSRDVFFQLLTSGVNNAAYTATLDRNRAKSPPLAFKPRGIRPGTHMWVDALAGEDLREKLAIR